MAAALEAALSTFAAGVLAVLLVLVLGSVALRYLFSTGLVGAEEAGLWLFLLLVSLGMPLAASGPLAMRLDLVARRLPQRLRLPAGMAADGVTVVAGLTLVAGGTDAAGLMGSTSVVLGLPDWLRPAALAVGGGLLIALLLLRRTAEGLGLSVLLSVLIGAGVYALPVDYAISWPPSLVALLLAGIGLLLGAPLAHCLLAATALAVPFGSVLPVPALVTNAASGLSRFLLLAIPFFLLAGGLLTVSGAAERLVRLAASLVGHRRAGLAQTTLLTSLLFSGASGSSVANAAFGAGTFYPQLVKNGYPPAQAGAVIAATSVLDNVIPPSIAFLLLAAATDLSVGALLLGGAYAGLVMAACLAVAIHLVHRGTDPMPRATGQERRRAFLAALSALGLVLVVVGGIRIGLVTPTEAAALAAGYALLLAVAHRSGRASLWSTFRQSAVEAAAIGLLIGAAAPMTFLLAVDDMAGMVTGFVTSLGGQAVVVLLLCNLVLLAAGLVLDIGAAILLLAPILLASAVAAGIDPVVFGVILVVNLMIGGLTPPVGILIFVVSGLTGVEARKLFRAVTPYLAALLVALLLLCLAALVL
ncbi:TRAP transporter large permease [Rhizobium halophilum]|uniref:TRAP transporter large permease n=1 Tax=Rhizobium halophilum TaxID=2846852 RepID=UPI001EFCDEDB|nr:TRAP transporter large permease [Rhizobium halophilum]MCF6369093.1 TRAP transporter large permease [Rhizobium halophilum]